MGRGGRLSTVMELLHLEELQFSFLNKHISMSRILKRIIKGD